MSCVNEGLHLKCILTCVNLWKSSEKTASLNASHSQRHGTKEGSTSHGSNSLQSTGWQFPQAAECVIDSLAPIPSTDSSNMAIEPPLSGPKASSIWRKRFSRSKSAIKSGLNSLNCASLFHPGRSGNLRARRNRSVIGTRKSLNYHPSNLSLSNA